MSTERNPNIVDQHSERQSHNEQLHRSHAEKLNQNRHEKAERARGGQEQAKTEAQHQVEQEAISGKEIAPQQSEKVAHIDQRTRSEQKLDSFNTTMHHVRQKLSKPERTLSKVIHQPVVEKASEVAGKTIARPSGVIGGTVAAFVGLLSVYGIAKFAGFSLTGSEMPILLAGGFALGLFVEWVGKAAHSIFMGKTVKNT